MRAQSPALAALATAQKTNRYIPLCSRPSAHGVFVQPERRLLSRASRGLRHASRERLWSTCPYSAVAGVYSWWLQLPLHVLSALQPSGYS